ncbi:MAG: HNH endonuclease [bacterium]
MWKFIQESKFYQVNEMGEVRRLSGLITRRDGKKYSITEQNMKSFITRTGYVLTPFNLDINRKLLVHRLVLEAFSPIDNMENLQVNHIDGNKQNNILSNLEWSTREENMQHAMRLGLFTPEKRCGEKHPMCKLSEDQVETIRILLNSKLYTQRFIAKMFNITETTISNIKNNKARKQQ